jgi:diguanylate cyclase (GGDEF)-like protein/PAS domain S-box-containing protein
VLDHAEADLVLQPRFVRYLICVVVAIVAATVPQGDHRLVMTIVLAASIPTQLLLERIRTSSTREVSLVCHDIAVALFMITVDPTIWHAGALTISASVLWLAVSRSSRMFAVVASLTFVGLVATGWHGQPQHWRLFVGLWASVTAGHGIALATIRNFRRSVVDRLDTVIEAARIVIHDENLGVAHGERMSGPIEKITGWTPEEWSNIDHRSLIHPDDLAGFWISLDTNTDGEVFDRTARFRRPDGSWAWLRDVSRVLIGADGAKTIQGMTIDVTEVREALESAEYRSAFDQLTALPNRFSFMNALERRLADGLPFGLLMLDLDGFKEINDTLGHAAGDELLVEFAARLRRTCKASDCVARLGGDEFAVLVDAADEFDLAASARRIAASTRAPIIAGSVPIARAVSIGGVLSSDHPIDRSTMMRWADIAMYDAKRQGESYRAFSTELERTSVFDLLLTAAFPEALESGQVFAHFQPTIDLSTGRLTGVELLARWDHPDHGLLGADRFTHLVRVSEHLNRFTEVMICQALSAHREFRKLGLDITLSVNISARSLVDVDFPEHVARLCLDYDVPASSLVLELTEDELMDTRSSTLDVIRRLNELEIGLSIDDFGTGYSSFSRLPSLPVDEIKIDRSFLWGVTDEPRNVLIISSIVELGRLLGYRVVAEGVETVGQMEMLQHLGCNIGQGYLFSRPMPLAALLATIAVPSWPEAFHLPLGDNRVTRLLDRAPKRLGA